MAYSCSSSTVKLNDTTGVLSGSASISDGSKTVATIPASGTTSKGKSNFSAGSNNGWNLEVTWNNDGTVSGRAVNGTNSTNVPVTVDHPGKPHHHPSGQSAKR